MLWAYSKKLIGRRPFSDQQLSPITDTGTEHRLYEPPGEAREENTEGNQEGPSRTERRGPLRAIRFRVRHTLHLLQGDGQDPGQHVWNGYSAGLRGNHAQCAGQNH